ncbi:SseB family protein [Gulosibacter bifidus]|uniref:SseB family protein n=1 Tax=Gulosibacter bifidus TaxID=272239 RepID=A0ABW5RM03_9MICO|nr:SseB family protein [Gulosibacter bifidus]
MVAIPEHLHNHLTDSAGQPWEGRTFSDNPWSDDDGSAPEPLLAALTGFRAGDASLIDVIDALRTSRLLIPLVAHLGEAGVNDAGVTVDKSADLSIVSVKSPDGRATLPVFTSVDAMQHWDATARPVPIAARKAALAAVSEDTQLMILDPGSETELAIRRPAVWAIAQDTEYTVSWQHDAVRAACAQLLADHPELVSVDLHPGDLPGKFLGPELIVELGVSSDLAEPQREQLLASVQQRLASDSHVVEAVDSMALHLAVIDADSLPAKEPTTESAPSKAGLFGWLRRR